MNYTCSYDYEIMQLPFIGGMLHLELALVFPEEEGMMQQSSVSISLSF